MNDKMKIGEIYYMLINRERNWSVLQDIPHILYLDLAIVFYFWLDDKTLRLVSNEDMKELRMTTKDLEYLATKNTAQSFPIEFRHIDDILNELSVKYKDSDIPLYCISNNSQFLGASAILYPQALWSASHILGDDLYILPSSIHECLVIPMYVECTRTELEEIVKDINRSIIWDTEFLSDHVYVYQKDEDILKI